jgi:acyl-CoA thioesterase-1
VLVLGDSLAAGFGLDPSEAFPALLQKKVDAAGWPFDVVNAGVSGDTSAGGVRRLEWLLRRRVDVLVLELGGNDGLRGLPVPEMKKNLAAMIEQSQKAGARVLLVGTRMPPNYGPEYTQAYEAVFVDLAKAHKVALAPDLTAGIGEKLELFLPDRVHPNESAQPALLDNVWKALRPLLK